MEIFLTLSKYWMLELWLHTLVMMDIKPMEQSLEGVVIMDNGVPVHRIA